jgi:hypothetical protein
MKSRDCLQEDIIETTDCLTPPFVRSDSKPEPSDYPALAAFDIKVDRKSKFPALLLAIATVRQTITNAPLQSELTKGCKAWWDGSIIKR